VLTRKRLPPPTLASLYPPVAGYRYFDAAQEWPFEDCAGVECARRRWWLAEHALLAYDSASAVESTLAALGFEVQVFKVPATSAFAYAAVKDGQGVLAFRGTQAMRPGDAPRKFKEVVSDWMIDAHFVRGECTHGQVHTGFSKALGILWPGLSAELPRAQRWWCTGHSLGGALAALAALRVVEAGAELAGAVTFGQPRVGDSAVAAALDRLGLVRVVNACDLIPDLPPAALGFGHGGTLAHLDEHKRSSYGQTVKRHLMRLPRNLRHGLGALTPIELIDHAPLHYAIKCFNSALEVGK
jgi:hypothetical protein